MYVNSDVVSHVTASTPSPAAAPPVAAGQAIAIAPYRAIAEPWHVNSIAASLAVGA